MRFSSPFLFFAALTLALGSCAGEEAATKKENAAVNSDRVEVTLRLAHATESGDDYAGAEKLYLRAVGQAPDQVTPQAELAEFYKRHRQETKAITSLEAALRISPGNAQLERELANIYIGLGHPEKALGILDAAVAANPRDALLYNSRGVALDQMGKYRQAQSSYATAIDLDPAGSATYKINSSMSFILAGSYNKAIALLRPMLDMPDSPPIVRQNLALAYGLKGDSETALKLGLQDLTQSEAEENLKFYRMLAHKHEGAPDRKVGGGTPSAVPASVVTDLFPSSDSAEPAPVVASAKPQTVVVPMVPSAPVTPAAKVKPAKPQEADDDETVPSPVGTRHMVVSKPAKREEDESEDIPPPVITSAPKPAQPLATMAPSGGDNPAGATPVTPGAPMPVLKPDGF